MNELELAKTWVETWPLICLTLGTCGKELEPGFKAFPTSLNAITVLSAHPTHGPRKSPFHLALPFSFSLLVHEPLESIFTFQPEGTSQRKACSSICLPLPAVLQDNQVKPQWNEPPVWSEMAPHISKGALTQLLLYITTFLCTGLPPHFTAGLKL